jgi:hypothetical protein
MLFDWVACEINHAGGLADRHLDARLEVSTCSGCVEGEVVCREDS